MKRQSFLFILLGLYAFHLYLKISHIAVPTWASSYVADLLCMPIFLSLSTTILAKTQQNPHFRLSVAMLVFATCYVSLLFELLLPYYFPQRFTSDIFDVLAYVLGVFVFVVFGRRSCV
jgi:hypothetical protein